MIRLRGSVLAAPRRRFGAAVAGAIVVGGSAAGARALAGVPLGAILGWRLDEALEAKRAARSADDAMRALPQVMDRLAVCVLAGMSVERALRTVAPRTPGALGEALAAGLRALDLGLPRASAFDAITASVPAPALASVVGALARAERDGTSVADALLAQAREVRAAERARAEAEARTAPVKLVFPIVFCFLPAFLVLTVVPIALSAFRTLGGI